jgi:hypothetical protein
VRARDVDCHQMFLIHTLNLQIFLRWWIITETTVWAWEGGVIHEWTCGMNGHTMSAYAWVVMRKLRGMIMDMCLIVESLSKRVTEWATNCTRTVCFPH